MGSRQKKRAKKFNKKIITGILISVSLLLGTRPALAVLQTSASFQTQVCSMVNGTLQCPINSNSLSTYALTIVNNLKNAPNITSDPEGCAKYSMNSGSFARVFSGDVSNIRCKQNMPNNAWNTYVLKSTNQWTNLQCIAFVAAIASGSNNGFNTFVDAYLMSKPGNVPNKYHWIAINSSNSTDPNDPNYPQAGDIPIWSDNNGNPPGHIAVLLSSPQPGGYLDVAEANWGSAPGIVISDSHVYKFQRTCQSFGNGFCLRLEGWLRLG